MNEIAKISVAKVIPAEIEGTNIDQYIEQVLPVINAKKDVVVTEDNFSEVKKLRTELRKDMSRFDDDVKLVKSESVKLINPWLTKAKKIQSAYKEADAALKSGVDFYENQLKTQKRDEIRKEINKLIAAELGAETLNVKLAQMFTFNERWLNKSIAQSEVELGISQEIERLKQLFSAYQEQVKFIKAYVKKVITDNGFSDGLVNADTYIELFDNGTESSRIMQMIDSQVENIKRQLEAKMEEELAKKRADEERRAQELAKANQVPVESARQAEPTYVEPVSNGPVELKTVTDNQIVLDISKALNKAENLTPEQRSANYDYLYQFSGNAQEMLILRRFMEYMRDLPESTFNFERK